MSPALLTLLGLAVKGSVVLAATAAIAAGLRGRSAALRHVVWLVGLGAAAALPLAEALVPPRPVPVPAAAVAGLTGVERSPSGEGGDWPPAARVAPPAAPSAVPGTVARLSESPPVRGRGDGVPTPTTPGGWVVSVWAAGAVLVLLRLLSGVVRLARWTRRASPVTDPAWLGLARGLSGRLGLRRGVTLLRGPGPTVPMTWGVIRPVVWLPAGADAWGDERRAVVLAHELAHVRRRDGLTQWVAHVAVALHWYNPLAHVAVRALREERERACDDVVLSLGVPGPTYADHLLAVVRGVGARRGPAAALAMARTTRFEGRLLGVLDTGAARRPPHRTHTALVLAGAAAVLVPLAALRPAPPEAQLEARAEPVRAEPITSVAPPNTTETDLRTRVDAPAPDGSRPSTVVQGAGSDNERERLLRSAVTAGPSGGAGQADVIAAARHVRSPGRRARVYDALIEQGLSPEGRLQLLGEVSALGSPADAARVLGAYRDRFGLGAATADAFFRAAEAMGSDRDHSTVLRAALTGPLDEAALDRLLVSASRLGPGEDKAVVLQAAAPAVRTASLRARYLEAARATEPDGDQADALAAVDASSEPPRAPVGTTPPSVGWHHGATDTGSHTDVHIRSHNASPTPSGEVEVVGPNGFYDLTETTAAGVRRFVVTPGPGGPSYRYSEDGAARPVDAAARAWIRSALRRAAGA